MSIFSRLTKTNSTGIVSLQNNYVATTAPTVNDDTSEGYSVGSVWIDVTGDERYVCLDATEGNAVWEKTTVGTATEVVNTPAGNISATNVQSAINELDNEKANTGDIPVKASTAEVDAGTNDAKFPTPDALAGSYVGTKSVVILPFGSDEAVATGDGTLAFTVPASMNGMNLVNVVASVHTKGVTGTTDVQIRARTGGVDSDMLSTKITLGDEFFASDEVIDPDNDDVATGDQIFVDVDAVHSGTAPNGLSVALEFRLP